MQKALGWAPTQATNYLRPWKGGKSATDTRALARDKKIRDLIADPGKMMICIFPDTTGSRCKHPKTEAPKEAQ